MTREVHPVAAIFPLMGEDELGALAEDIKANGLQQPVVLDAEGRVIDGRNRLAACELAGVKPKTTTVNGEDPMSLAVSLNVKRRNLTKGQRAIAAAEAWDMTEAGTRDDSRAKKLARLFDVNNAYVSQARALVEHAPDLAESAKTGAKSLAEASKDYATRIAERAAEEAERVRREAQRQRLAAEHADLFEALERGDLTVVDAMAEVADREAAAQHEAEDEAQSRRIFTQHLVQAVDLLQMKTDEESVAADVQRLDPAELPSHWSQEALDRAADYLSKFNAARRGT